ncbi:DUF3265 domain-containing protein [Vibrio parahaemolyticus]|nr:DUF3265 domain-containing protein [Vibrio crassostreae]MCX8844872.1 DUF3265 domain-containing protein [Vibrio parahaemolyticus]
MIQHAWHFWFESSLVIKMLYSNAVVACFTP